MSWSIKEENLLIEKYPSTKLNDLCLLFNKSKSCILSKAWILKLKKNKNVYKNGKLDIKSKWRNKCLEDAIPTAVAAMIESFVEAKKIGEFVYSENVD